MPRAKSTSKKTKTTKQTKKTAPKSRIIFDKKVLAYKEKTGKDNWDYSVTNDVIQKSAKVQRRNLMFRTIKMIVEDNSVKTFADILKLRTDWLLPDKDGNWNSDERIEMQIQVCKDKLEEIELELIELGFARVGLVDKLVEEDRKTKAEKTLTEKLEELGLKRGSQLELFPDK